MTYDEAARIALEWHRSKYEERHGSAIAVAVELLKNKFCIDCRNRRTKAANKKRKAENANLPSVTR